MGNSLRNLPLDYSQKNFFPEDTESALMEFGVFMQNAGIAYGKGRVLAFTDSTVFSNFWMFMPGKPELLLKSLQWLNRENVLSFSPRSVAVTGTVAGMLTLACAAWLLRRRCSIFPLGPCLCIALLTFGCALLVFTTQAKIIQTPDLRKPVFQVCFESSYSTGQFPKDLKGFFANAEDQISTFYVWTQRLGCVPSLEKDPVKALEKGDIAVIVKPNRQIRETEALLKLVEEGKTLLLLDNGANGAYTEELLKQAGLRLKQTNMTATASAYALFGEPMEIPLTEKAAAVVGGTPLVTDGSGNAVFSVQKVGKGAIAVFSDPDLLHNAHLGDVSANLNEKTQTLTRLSFQMFKYLMTEGG